MLYTGISEDISLRRGMTTTGLLLMNLKALLRKNAASFITTSITQQYLSVIEKSFPDLVAAVRDKRSTEFISQVLRALVREGISLRNFDSILQSILDFDFIPIDGSSVIIFDDRVTCNLVTSPEPENSPLLTAEYARIQLKLYISHLLTRTNNTLFVHLLDPEIEKMVAKGMSQQEQSNFMEAINLEVSPTFFKEGKYYPILTTADSRSNVKEICKKRFPELPVISFQELSPESNIQPVSRISMV
jgi:type III secretion protein V